MRILSHWSAVTSLTGTLLCFAAAAPTQAQSPGVARFAAGKTAFDKGDFDTAADAFGDAVKADGNNAQYHIWLGNAYAQKAIRSNVFTKARLAPRMRDEWLRATVLDPKDYEAHEYLYEFYTQAPGIMGGSAEKAAAEVATMMRLNPYKAGLELANVEMGAKQYAAAEARIRALMAAYPDSAVIPGSLAALQQNERHYDDAWTTLDAARARFPDNTYLEYLIGRGAALSGTRLDAGHVALEHVIAAPAKLDPSYISPAHYRLGMIAEQRGDKGSARTEYTTAIKANPKNTDAQKALDKLGAQ